MPRQSERWLQPIAGSGSGSTSGGVFVSAATSLSNGAAVGFQVDQFGNTKVAEQFAPLYEDNTIGVAKVEHRYTYQSLNSLVTLTVKSGAGFIHTLNIGNVSGPTIELYDSLTATGTLIGRFGPASQTPSPVLINASFGTGLTINPQPGAAVLPCLTVSYR
jgi:hypothetical protein